MACHWSEFLRVRRTGVNDCVFSMSALIDYRRSSGQAWCFGRLRHNATLGRRDFYRQLCATLGLQPKASAAAVFAQVSAHLQDLGQEQVHPVLLLDESHLLQQDVLEHLHILLNFSWDSRSLLSVIVIGLPELWDQLELRRNRSGVPVSTEPQTIIIDTSHY